MAARLEPSDKLFAGVILTVVGLVGLFYSLVYISRDYSVVIGDLRGAHAFYGGGYTILSLIITSIFIIVTLLGVYIVYDTIKKDSKSNSI